jgi:hypothetical protein
MYSNSLHGFCKVRKQKGSLNAEMFLELGFVFTHEAVRLWEATFAPLLTDRLRRICQHSPQIYCLTQNIEAGRILNPLMSFDKQVR